MSRVLIRASRNAVGAALGAVAILTALTTTRGQGAPPAPVAEATPTQPTALIEGGEAPDLFLVYTGDVIGYLDPCG